MKSVADLLKELGFNSGAPRGPQLALLRHLSQNAMATGAQNTSINSEQSSPALQLSFDDEVLGRQPKKSRPNAIAALVKK